MKLSNYLTIRLAAVSIVVLLLWSCVYLVIQMREVYDGIDEGLNNLKQELILDANNTPHFMEAMQQYEPFNLRIAQITREEAMLQTDRYTNESVWFATEEEDEEVRMLTSAFLCTQDNNYYRVQFFTSTVETDDMIKNMLYLLLSLWVTFAVIVIITTKRIIWRANRPFFKTLNVLKAFELEKSPHFELPTTDIEEYKALNHSVAQLLNDNVATYNEQKAFIENASHELQTPIAVAVANIELLMADTQLDQEQMELLGATATSLGRAKRLNSTLLLLSKIRNRQFAQRETVHLNSVFRNVLDDYEALIEHKGIDAEIAGDADISIAMHPDLAYILASNLIKNAIVHNLKQGGSLRISIRPNAISIANSGQALPKGTDIFKRYVSTDAEHHGSSGLGLSIVKSIVELYHMTIGHVFANGIHTITIRLPRM